MTDITVPNDRGTEAMAVHLIDESGGLASAEAAGVDVVIRNVGALLEDRIAVVAGDDPRSMLVLWTGFSCGASGTVTIDPRVTRITVAPDPIGTCDLVPAHRGIVLTFSEAVDVSTVAVVLEPTEVLEESEPPPSAG